MSVYQFGDVVTRSLLDETPLVFEWLRAGVTPVVEVAFDNVSFVALTGTVSEITNVVPRYRINYNIADRPATPGIITYKMAEGGDTAYLEVMFTTNPNTVVIPEILPPDISTLATLVASVGPRRVKTKDMEVEAHSIDAIQKLHERVGPKPIGLGQIRGDIVVPKGHWWCNDRYR